MAALSPSGAPIDIGDFRGEWFVHLSATDEMLPWFYPRVLLQLPSGGPRRPARLIPESPEAAAQAILAALDMQSCGFCGSEDDERARYRWVVTTTVIDGLRHSSVSSWNPVDAFARAAAIAPCAVDLEQATKQSYIPLKEAIQVWLEQNLGVAPSDSWELAKANHGLVVCLIDKYVYNYLPIMEKQTEAYEERSAPSPPAGADLIARKLADPALGQLADEFAAARKRRHDRWAHRG